MTAKIEIENFLDDYEGFREIALSSEFESVENPFDSVTYPAICKDIPQGVSKEVEGKLSELFCGKVKINSIFMRLSCKDVPVPHQAHHDEVMGDYSFMLYLSKPVVGTGTSFLAHKATGISDSGLSPEDFLRDTNVPEAWEVYDMCEAKENKACIFDAGLLHRAEPVGGYGKDLDDGRLVLTAFFEVEDD